MTTAPAPASRIDYTQVLNLAENIFSTPKKTDQLERIKALSIKIKDHMTKDPLLKGLHEALDCAFTNITWNVSSDPEFAKNVVRQAIEKFHPKKNNTVDTEAARVRAEQQAFDLRELCNFASFNTEKADLARKEASKKAAADITKPSKEKNNLDNLKKEFRNAPFFDHSLDDYFMAVERLEYYPLGYVVLEDKEYRGFVVCYHDSHRTESALLQFKGEKVLAIPTTHRSGNRSKGKSLEIDVSINGKEKTVQEIVEEILPKTTANWTAITKKEHVRRVVEKYKDKALKDVADEAQAFAVVKAKEFILYKMFHSFVLHIKNGDGSTETIRGITDDELFNKLAFFSRYDYKMVRWN